MPPLNVFYLMGELVVEDRLDKLIGVEGKLVVGTIDSEFNFNPINRHKYQKGLLIITLRAYVLLSHPYTTPVGYTSLVV